MVEDNDQEQPESPTLVERIGTHDLQDAVEEAREIVDFTARQVDDFRSVVEAIHSPFLKAVMASYVLSALVGMLVFLTHEFRAWYMALAMYAVILVFLLLYVKAHYARRAFSRYFFALLTTALGGFWLWVMMDEIEGKKVWVDADLVFREPVVALWYPIALMGLVLVALLVHLFVLGRGAIPAEELPE